jgi:hypothetical protein
MAGFPAYAAQPVFAGRGMLVYNLGEQHGRWVPIGAMSRLLTQDEEGKPWNTWQDQSVPSPGATF